MFINFNNHNKIIVQQRKELIELFGFETRNKYEILDMDKNIIGFCAEQNKGILGFLFRQFLGHWRRFHLHIFDVDRKLALVAKHPFRFFFQRIEIEDSMGKPVGSLQQRFGIFTKKFDIQDSNGATLFIMRSGLFKFWTFPITRQGKDLAVIRKRWSGLLKEVFMDADNFQIEFLGNLTNDEKSLILVSGVFVDLQYFENKAD